MITILYDNYKTKKLIISELLHKVENDSDIHIIKG